LDLQPLLSSIIEINKKYEKIFNTTGEKFNVFDILDLTTKETSHSLFIASLLNPKGTHGKGTLFLKYFLDIIKSTIKTENYFIENAVVKTEIFIGNINKENDSGGRLDIIVTNNKDDHIIIENKINADDEYHQLLRYSKYPNAKLLYLTKDGRKASSKGTGGEDINYTPISYKEHILNWLELCKKESAENPILHETLVQYIILVKKITGQGRDKEMQNDDFEIITQNAENMAAFKHLQKIDLLKFKLYILEHKLKPLMEKLAKDLKNMELEEFPEFKKFLDTKGMGFSFKREGWKKIKIDFIFEGIEFSALTYGFSYIESPSEELDKYLRKITDYEHNEKNPLYQYMDGKYYNWESDFFYDFLSSEKDIIQTFKEKINELLKIVDGRNDL
jgi:hypothetical protein